jgi:hypothetical protein
VSSGSAGMPPRYRVASLEGVAQATILHQREPDGTLWGTSGRKIVRRRPGEEWAQIASLPFVWQRDLFALVRPAARALRADKANLFVNRTAGVLAIRASQVYRLETSGMLTPLFAIAGDSVLHGGICEDRLGWTTFGEYFMNPARSEVRIWRVNPKLDGWEIAYTFPAGEVRHIHGVYRDPYDAEALWVTAGDDEGECYFYRTRDRFQTLERLGEGGQLWRAVRLFFTPEHVCWLTDSQVEQNRALRMERRTSRLEQGMLIEAPAWYGAQTLDGLYLAFTTVEPGPAVKRNSAAVLVSEDAFHWQEIHRFEKDAWRPMKLFKYGVISCPAGPVEASEFYISGEGLYGLDGTSAVLRIVSAG